MTEQARVLVTTPLPSGSETALLRAGHEIVRAGGCTHADLIRLARDADAVVCTLTDHIDEQVLEAGSGRLQVVANIAVGYNNIDLGTASRLGIIVCNTPRVLDEATADTAFLLLLAAARRASEAEQDLRNGRWKGWRLTDYLGQEFADRTLGLVGYGRIGTAMARRAAGFGLVVRHHTRRDTGQPGWTGDLDEMVGEADFVSLHLPLTPETHHLFDEARFRRMKRSAVFVNTARGAIVDERALAEALHSGTIFAAGLDVYEHEPRIDPLLLTAPRTVLLPHIGSAAEQTRRQMAELACQAAADVLAGRRPANVVNGSPAI
jgi:glyoxylate reductase